MITNPILLRAVEYGECVHIEILLFYQTQTFIETLWHIRQVLQSLFPVLKPNADEIVSIFFWHLWTQFGNNRQVLSWVLNEGYGRSGTRNIPSVVCRLSSKQYPSRKSSELNQTERPLEHCSTDDEVNWRGIGFWPPRQYLNPQIRTWSWDRIIRNDPTSFCSPLQIHQCLHHFARFRLYIARQDDSVDLFKRPWIHDPLVRFELVQQHSTNFLHFACNTDSRLMLWSQRVVLVWFSE